MSVPKPITFDRFIRALISLLVVAVIIYVIYLLSSVLLPFAVAMLLAYLSYPLVSFLQYKCRLRNRLVSIFISLILIIAAVVGFCWLLIPPMIEQGEHLKVIVQNYLQYRVHPGELLQALCAMSEVFYPNPIYGTINRVRRFLKPMHGTVHRVCELPSPIHGTIHRVCINLDTETENRIGV